MTHRISNSLKIMVIATLLGGCGGVSDALNPLYIESAPRLQNNEPERRAQIINAAAFNKKAIEKTVAPYTGYLGDLRIMYNASPSLISGDLQQIAGATTLPFNPNEMVRLNFNNVSLNFILEQLLRGTLLLNYIAPDNLPNISSFRTETPIPKSRVLQIVRDLLARNNLVIENINGVYHIGEQNLIDEMKAASQQGKLTENVSHIIQLPRGNAPQVAELAQRILPTGVSILASSSANTLVIQANPNDLASVERLLQSLSNTAIGYDQIAIIPVQRSNPEATATKLNEFFTANLRESSERLTIIPLQGQQSLLVGTSHPNLMRSVHQMIKQMDRTISDQMELRVIPLTHLMPSQITPQLIQIFNAGPENSNSSKPKISVPPQSLTGVNSRLRPLQPSPQTPPPQQDAAQGASRNNKGEQSEKSEISQQETTTVSINTENNIRIVSDDRTNSILVYSDYATFKKILDVVQLLDVAQAQVIIEATVIEVELNNNIDSGVSFFLKYKGLTVGTTALTGPEISANTDLGPINVSAALKALSSQTNMKVVSSPYLTVVDGQTARLVIGDQIPFAVTTEKTNNQGQKVETQNIQILDTGIVLQITPRIHANNSVNLEIIQSVSTPKASAAGQSLTPTISTRDITSQILAQSGRTILLGGLIEERIARMKKGVPIASDIPVLGQLFRQDENHKRRTELLVLLTPRVVRTSSEIEGITRLLQNSQTKYIQNNAKSMR